MKETTIRSVLMHGHHAGSLFSFGLTLEERTAYIKANKPEDEQPLRLALMQDVTALLARNVSKTKLDAAWTQFEVSMTKFYAARTKFDAAWTQFDAARAKLDVAKAKFYAARTKLDVARAKLDVAKAKSDAARTKLDVAKAKLDVAKAKSDAAKTKFYAALAKSDAARAKSDVALAKLDAAKAKFDSEAFHREHCHPNCPWDGKTIFAKGTGIEVLD